MTGSQPNSAKTPPQNMGKPLPNIPAHKVRAVLIAGPTASGKSTLGLDIAKAFDGSIINADSMQVYKEMQILTARPLAADMDAIPHHLYGHVSAKHAYSTGDWVKDALGAITEVEKAGRLPIFVGGTGLYFRALIEGMADIPAIPASTRQNLRTRLQQKGLGVLHAALSEIDPPAARRIAVTDPQRTLRALEVHAATGRTLTAWHSDPLVAPFQGDMCKLVLMPTRDWLYERCDRRFDAMLAGGVETEVDVMARLALAPDMPAMKALGLPELLAVRAGNMTAELAREQAQQQTRRYAKRQVTWLRHQMMSWNFINEQEYYNKSDNTFSYIINNA